MNKLGLLLGELHQAETDLAAEFREVADRQAADHGTSSVCRILAGQCDRHAGRIHDLAGRFGKDLPEPRRPGPVASAAGALRQWTSERIGRHPGAGLLLLRDLRQLYLMAQAVDVHLVMLGQAAQAVRDRELLEAVTGMHQETATQIGWVSTRLKEAAPQVLAVAD